MRARFLVPALALTTGLALAACAPSEEPTPTVAETTASPTPSETPSPTPTPVDPQTEKVRGASQTVLDFRASVNALAERSYEGWELEMTKYWGTPELMSRFDQYFRTAFETGRRVEGETRIESITILEYVEDPTGGGHEQVRLEYCEDNSAATHFNGDGTVLEKVGPIRLIYVAFLQRQDDGRWTFNELTADPDRIC